VTPQALAVVIRNVPYERFVRVVTRNAGNSPVGGIITAAVGQTVKLEPHVEDVVRTFGSRFGPGGMAASTNFSELLGIEPGPFLHLSRSTPGDRRSVFFAMLVAPSALNTRHRPRRVRRMAAKTPPGFLAVDFAAKGLFER